MCFVLPVKRLRVAKSRLLVPATWRPTLAEAMFRDTLDSVLAADLGPAVVVSPDEAVLECARDTGAAPLRHHGQLNDAIVAAAGPGAAAAVMPDLPALRPRDLRDLLATRRQGAVGDRTGLGTTVLFGRALRPAFGPDSFARHLAAGYAPVRLPDCGLTVDVDTIEDLAIAASLGLGARTHAVYQGLRADPAGAAGARDADRLSG